MKRNTQCYFPGSRVEEGQHVPNTLSQSKALHAQDEDHEWEIRIDTSSAEPRRRVLHYGMLSDPSTYYKTAACEQIQRAQRYGSVSLLTLWMERWKHNIFVAIRANLRTDTEWKLVKRLFSAHQGLYSETTISLTFWVSAKCLSVFRAEETHNKNKGMNKKVNKKAQYRQSDKFCP